VPGAFTPARSGDLITSRTAAIFENRDAHSGKGVDDYSPWRFPLMTLFVMGKRAFAPEKGHEAGEADD